MSRRASLPGADELFRRTSSDAPSGGQAAAPNVPEEESIDLQDAATEEAVGSPDARAPDVQEDKSTNLRVAAEMPPLEDKPKSGPRHDEKITFYCTSDDLVALERARLTLRAGYSIAADRGRIVRAALNYVLEDFDSRGDDSVLFRRLLEDPR